jgi:hypothetical protein
MSWRQGTPARVGPATLAKVRQFLPRLDRYRGATMSTNSRTDDVASRHPGGDDAADELDVAARLHQLGAPAATPERASTDAATATQLALSEIWRRELDLAHVSIHDNFIDVGGHSIAAVRCAWQVRVRFAVDLPLDAFFGDPGTIASLAEMVDALRARSDHDSAVS